MHPDFDRQGLLNIFATEASDGLLKLSTALDPRDGSTPTPEALHAQYIVAHSLTGAASLYGFMGCANLAKIMAQILDQTNNVPMQEWPKTVTLLRDIVAALRTQIDNIGQHGVEDPAAFAELKARYALPLQEMNIPVPTEAEPAPSAQEESLPDSYYCPDMEAAILEYFVPEAQEYLENISLCLLRLETAPESKDTVHQLFRAAHTLKGSAFTVGFQVIGDLTHHMEDIMGAIRDGRMHVTAELTDVFFRAVDEVRLLLGRDPAKLSQIRREFGPIMQRLRQVSSGTTATPPATVQPRAESPAKVGEEIPAASRTPEIATNTVRVSRDRLERLLNLVGELVIGRSRLEQRLGGLEQLSRQVLMFKGRMLDTVRSFEDKYEFTLPAQSTGANDSTSLALPVDFGSLEFDKYDDFNILARRMTEVSADVGEAMAQLDTSIRQAREDMGLLQHLTVAMRGEIASTRMVPIGTLFTRFQKAIREVARQAGKNVTVSFSGADTEIDASVVQQLADPLIHIMRNSVAHGIETPAARIACGKPEGGTIYLSAMSRGSMVVLEIEDDGAGMNLEKIKAKAVSLGLVRPEYADMMSPAEVTKLIYLPGFTTADEVGGQAGRGVGMDVVKRVVTQMSGQIEVETEQGIGTKFTLSIPLTLLISSALMVRAGDQQYAMLLPHIREILLPPSGAVEDIGGIPIFQLRAGEAVEIRSLARLLGTAPMPHDGPLPVVVVNTPTGTLGLEVDALLGLQEIVVKTLGSLKLFQGSCYSGATIDPEGRVVLVVDVGSLVSAQERSPALPDATSLHDVLQLGMGDATVQKATADQDSPVILLIDDSLSVRKFIGRMLETAGYHVQTAADGEEGLRKAMTTPYRLIITDLEMPKMNGYELIQALRERPQTRTTPIIVMTTRAGEKHKQMAQSLGVTAYLTKPVEERALIREISQFVSGPAGAKL